jgi:hypothetical protein
MAVGICLFLRSFLLLIVDAGADGKAQWSEMAMRTCTSAKQTTTIQGSLRYGGKSAAFGRDDVNFAFDSGNWSKTY